MKKHLTILALTLFALINFNACHDDDDDKSKIYFYYSGQDGEPMSDKLSSINEKFFNSTNRYGFVAVAGGEGKYSATSSDQDIVEDSSIEFDENYYSNTTTLSFKLKKEGFVTLTIADEKGNRANLKVIATRLSKKVEIEATELTINNEVSPSVKAEIETDIEQNNLQIKNLLVLNYKETDEGEMIIYTDSKGSNMRFEGTFKQSIAENNSDYMLRLIFNGQTHDFRTPYEIQIENKDTEAKRSTLGEDLTEYYKTKYPNENITKVSYGMILLVKK